MTAYVHVTGWVAPEPVISLNTASKSNPFVTVELTRDGMFDIAVHNAAEARALKEAFTKAERLLSGDES